jgi:ABC-type multidrug transport system fused ATPase/permease subunit
VQATFARKETESYASAGNVAEEVISAIRTVYAFGGEDKEVNRYETNLLPALRSGIKRNIITGLGNGILYATLYLGLALGIWYGVKLIVEEDSGDYSIGDITLIFWCVLGAGSSLGML